MIAARLGGFWPVSWALTDTGKTSWCFDPQQLRDIAELEVTSQWIAGETAETYPTGL